jgi:hypothetical protein
MFVSEIASSNTTTPTAARKTSSMTSIIGLMFLLFLGPSVLLQTHRVGSEFSTSLNSVRNVTITTVFHVITLVLVIVLKLGFCALHYCNAVDIELPQPLNASASATTQKACNGGLPAELIYAVITTLVPDGLHLRNDKTTLDTLRTIASLSCVNKVARNEMIRALFSMPLHIWLSGHNSTGCVVPHNQEASNDQLWNYVPLRAITCLPLQRWPEIIIHFEPSSSRDKICQYRTTGDELGGRMSFDVSVNCVMQQSGWVSGTMEKEGSQQLSCNIRFVFETPPFMVNEVNLGSIRWWSLRDVRKLLGTWQWVLLSDSSKNVSKRVKLPWSMYTALFDDDQEIIDDDNEAMEIRVQRLTHVYERHWHESLHMDNPESYWNEFAHDVDPDGEDVLCIEAGDGSEWQGRLVSLCDNE